MKGYKTVAVNGAAAVLPMLDLALNNGALLAPLLGPQGAAVISILGLVNIILRWVTTTPVFNGNENGESNG